MQTDENEGDHDGITAKYSHKELLIRPIKFLLGVEILAGSSPFL